MSPRGHGRHAALPPTGFHPQPRRRNTPTGLVVRFVAEDHGAGSKEYDFTALPVSPALQAGFAEAFAQRTRPGGGLRALQSATTAYRQLVTFAGYLAGLRRPPDEPAQLTPAHLDGWRLHRSHVTTILAELTVFKATLRKIPGISPAFAAKLSERTPRRPQNRLRSYSRAEFDRILNAARSDIRRATSRIRGNQELLARWRAGQIDRAQDEQTWLRGQVLDEVDRHADVPRTPGRGAPRRWVTRLGGVPELITALHLTVTEAIAFAVLLVGLTGQNRGTILSAPATHHRPDGYVGPVGTAIVELDKPRRRGHDRHMDVALVGLSDWIPTPDAPAGAGGRDDLRSPFGVYLLAHELTAAARRIAGTDRLLVWWAPTGPGVGGGLRTELNREPGAAWAARHDLPADPDPSPDSTTDEGTQLTVTFPRLRLTYIELHQKPVAHSEPTLANDYLLRNRGNLADYQRVVAEVLAEEVAKAKTHVALRTLTPAEAELARTDPAMVAARHGLDPTTLRRMIGGELDTVMTACADNLASPHTPAGQPCRASFMLCLSCPCARALPHHLPLQVAVHDALLARREQMTPLRWAQRYGQPHVQLANLIDRAGSAVVDDARAHLTDDQHQLVDRFLHRELDLP